MISCIVIDDEPLATEGLERYIRKTPFLEFICSFNSAKQARAFLQKNQVDLLLLDIQMPEMNGIELLKSLKNAPRVIFTTAFRKYAFEGFQLDAVDYLLKPIDYSRFLKSINKVFSLGGNQRSEEAIFIKCDGIIAKILTKDILFAETAKDYVIIHTLEKKYMSLFSLKQLENYVPPNQFYRVHRSYLVNLTKVDKIEGSLLHIGPHKISCSKTTKDNVKSLILGDRLINRNMENG
ncbi:putative response regulatory protein [Flagellimonas maritima]|uniref:Putative response regulatory protein n=1 Tax=Flagellimonas maritima TaxID=1383885 RepID=A0A2Z4LTV3_9FLAO|nr:LytTR family DNA-binding domain-containing protein [Allomuricauda aurantiaca]AWX45172.1 putative response regulatory protein [Allomuricauda aurantiaca]